MSKFGGTICDNSTRDETVSGYGWVQELTWDVGLCDGMIVCTYSTSTDIAHTYDST